MITNLTTARPYSKAIFALALRDKTLPEWQHALNNLALVAIECKKRFLLKNPGISDKQKLSFFHEISKNFPVATNLIRILTERKKLEILPEIADGYQKLFFEHEKILPVKVETTHELTLGQKERLTTTLQKRFQQNNKILLQYQINKELIGGAVIYIADQVIDGSIKGMLQRLKQNLVNQTT